MSKSNDNIFERRNEFNRPGPRRVSEYSINSGSGYSLPLAHPGGPGGPGGRDISRSLSRDHSLHRRGPGGPGGRDISRSLSRDHSLHRRGPGDGNNSNAIIELNNVSREESLGTQYPYDPNRQSGMYIDRQPEDGYVYIDHFGTDPTNYGCCSEMWCLIKYGPECLPIRASAVSLLDTVNPYMKYILLLLVGQISTLIIVALSQNKKDAADTASPPPP